MMLNLLKLAKVKNIDLRPPERLYNLNGVICYKNFKL